MSPAWLSRVGTIAALEYLEGVGIESIRPHDARLANALREELSGGASAAACGA